MPLRNRQFPTSEKYRQFTRAEHHNQNLTIVTLVVHTFDVKDLHEYMVTSLSIKVNPTSTPWL